MQNSITIELEDTQKWESKLDRWINGIDSMDQMIKCFTEETKDDNLLVELRDLHHQINWKFKSKVNRFSKEIKYYTFQSELNSFPLEKEHYQFAKRMEHLEYRYKELRGSLLTKLGVSTKNPPPKMMVRKLVLRK